MTKKFIYLDTNAFSNISKSSKLVDAFLCYCTSQNLNLVVSETNLSELIKYNNYKQINSFIGKFDYSTKNIFFIPTPSRIYDLEIRSFPSTVNLELVDDLHNEVVLILNGRKLDLNDIACSKGFCQAVSSRIAVIQSAFKVQIDEYKSEFFPKNGEYYEKAERGKILNEMLKNCRNSIKRRLKKSFIDENFRYRLISTYILFYKFVSDLNRKFVPNDALDMFHMAYSPYVDVFVSDNDSINILGIINKRTKLLKSTKLFKWSDFEHHLLKFI